MYNNNDVKTINKTMLHNLWAIIDELRKENDNLKGLNSESEDLQDQYIATIRENRKLKQENKRLNELIKTTSSHNKELQGLISENKELKNNLKLKENELLEMSTLYDVQWKENNNLRKKLNETITCKDYESEASEYFSHNPQGNKVSFFMFDEDYINTYDIDESMEICTIYNEDLKEYRR